MVRNSFDMPLPEMSPPRSRRCRPTPRLLRSSTTVRASRAERNSRSSFGEMMMSPLASRANSAPPAGLSTTGMDPRDALLDDDVLEQ